MPPDRLSSLFLEIEHGLGLGHGELQLAVAIEELDFQLLVPIRIDAVVAPVALHLGACQTLCVTILVAQRQGILILCSGNRPFQTLTFSRYILRAVDYDFGGYPRSHKEVKVAVVRIAAVKYKYDWVFSRTKGEDQLSILHLVSCRA